MMAVRTRWAPLCARSGLIVALPSLAGAAAPAVAGDAPLGLALPAPACRRGAAAISARSVARSLYRIFNATEYRIYRKAGGEPRMGVDSVFAANATLPYSPVGMFANDTWFLGVSKFNSI